MRLGPPPLRRWSVPLGALALVLSLGSAAPAAPEPGVSPLKATAVQQTQAQEFYERGVDLYKAKAYEAAGQAFLEAYAVVASPNARMMYARCLRDSGDAAGALEEFARTQQEAARLAVEAPKYAQAAEQAETEVSALLPNLAAVALDFSGDAAGVQVTVGERAVPRELWTAVVVAPGAVAIVARWPDGRSARLEAQGVTGKIVRVKVEPAAPRAAATAGTEVPPPGPVTTAAPSGTTTAAPGEEPPATPAGTDLRLPAYVAGGVGVLGFIGFAVFGSMSSSTYSDLEAACANGTCPPDRASDIDSGKSQQTLANVGLLVGLVGVGAGVALFTLSEHGDEHARGRAVTLHAKPGALALSGRF